jgi:hypothetical protein
MYVFILFWTLCTSKEERAQKFSVCEELYVEYNEEDLSSLLT